MTHTKAWQRREKERQAAAERAVVEDAGLLSAGKEAPFFKMLGIGEERELGVGRVKRKVWYAPTYLVKFNRYMKRRGISSKIRTKTIRCYIEGTDPPASVLDAIAGYTEEQLTQR